MNTIGRSTATNFQWTGGTIQGKGAPYSDPPHAVGRHTGGQQ